MKHRQTEGSTTNTWNLEPAVIRGLVVSLFAVLALFGLEWATEANAMTIETFLVTLLPIISGLWTRPAVTPVAKTAAEEVEHQGRYESGPAAPYPTGTPVEVVPDYDEREQLVEEQRREDERNDQVGG